MTAKGRTSQRKRAQSKGREENAVSIGGLAALLALFSGFFFSQSISHAVKEGIELCLGTIIPSLFPFMVLSRIVVDTDILFLAGRWLCRPWAELLGISKRGAQAVLMGFLCGFPVGTLAALSMHRRGEIDRAQAERIIAVCNIPSPGFLINVAGTLTHGSTGFGVILYIIHILSAGILGVLMRARYGRADAVVPRVQGERSAGKRRVRMTELLVGAVADSAKSIGTVCAFVVFFFALAAPLCGAISPLPLPPAVGAILMGALELSGGVRATAGLGGLSGRVLCAAITGWSGLAVHCQMAGILHKESIALSPYFRVKAASALLCGVLSRCVLGLCEGRAGGGQIVGAWSVQLPIKAELAGVAVIAAFSAVGCLFCRRREPKRDD